MKRAPIVLTGTAAGLLAVVGYHTAVPQAPALASASSAGAGASTLNLGGTSASSGTSTPAQRSATATTASASSASTSSPSTTRSATGSDVQYPFGDLQVKVTMTANRITNVAVARHDTYDAQSSMIDQYAIPQLRSQALSRQSARIDGVSGASYTSAAYEQSLQSAIDKLKA